MLTWKLFVKNFYIKFHKNLKYGLLLIQSHSQSNAWV